jgi:hypothetical protein
MSISTTESITKSELEAAVRNPYYGFEGRVRKQMEKGKTRADAEAIVRRTLLARDLPATRPYIYVGEVTEDGEKKKKRFFCCAGTAIKIHGGKKNVCEALNHILGTNGERGMLDNLLDSQIVEIARVFGIRVEPFVRELLIDPLRHFIQFVWYRDVDGFASASREHLEKNLKICLDRYNVRLLEWRADEATESSRKSPSKRQQIMSKQFIRTPGAHPQVASGRESALLNVISSKKAMVFSEIVKAAEGRVHTKQDFEMIVARFLKELIEHGAVKEV